MSEFTWFITGSSRGFGRALAEAALRRGDRVAATARTPEQLAGLVAAYGDDRVVTLPLDVTDPVAARAALSAARDRFGRIDVLVNNAGYANVAPIETGSPDDFRAQFETNFWGVYNVTTAAIPLLREQGGGLVIQFSSIGGRVGGSAGIGSYQAAKFAVDGFSRVLAAETAPFGVRVLVVEPSGFATDWAGSSMTVGDIPAGYESTVGAMGLLRSGRVMAGDPERAAEILVRVAHAAEQPSHLPLGRTAATMAADYSRRQLAEAGAWREVSISADAAEAYPVLLPGESAAE
ncbi:short-chain dehydrogenase/reductase [Leifsonia sp. LS1]|uniref:SDR family NAD(P)-dependent oxidoreductase n=1 Tax=Leifsonia sp. LS1 TaxID=2828483 RepID=UPI001CFDF692|nr:SDR family NAD(P)-dependent oxidoreductase [Leifsonia sp. LS1]GIT79837.1 short-chain dehydrogenase/reductase [Leifsonia sp. LS1]